MLFDGDGDYPKFSLKLHLPFENLCKNMDWVQHYVIAPDGRTIHKSGKNIETFDFVDLSQFK